MVTPVFENKVKEWERKRLEVRKGISDPHYNEQESYFTELEQMAFSSPVKKKEMNERIVQLREFALGIAGIKPDLSAALNSFLTLSETLFGNPDFKSVAIKEKLAADLLSSPEKEKPRPQPKDNGKTIVEMDTIAWDNATSKLWTGNIWAYDSVANDFLIVLFNMINAEKSVPSAEIKRLITFANQISGKEAQLAADVQKFAALSDKYFSNGKMDLFQRTLANKGILDKWIETYNSFIKKIKEEGENKRREEDRRKEEEERNKREKEEPRTKGKERKKEKNSHGCLWFLFLTGIFWAGYQFWYKDYKRDKNAPRSYVYATNLFLRSSAIADVEYNRITTIPYGSELITYSNENGWAHVKADGKKGYVASDYLLNSEEFHLLNGVWGNEDAKDAVSTAKCRLAILNYLKNNGIKTGSTAWQLYAKPKEIKPNSVLYPRLNDGYDNFTEFAFILKDNQTGNRRLALYSFEEDETPVFRYTEDTPVKGDIKSITYNKWNNKYKVTYSNQESGTPPKTKKEPVKETQPVSSNKLTVLSTVFANMDDNGDISSEYGQQLYSDMQYLIGKVSYRRQSATPETVTLKVKIISPNGTVAKGKVSPAGYTFEQKITLSEKEGTFETTGWGSSGGKSYLPGTYHYEIWMDGAKLYTKSINIKEKKKEEENTNLSDDHIYDAAEQMPEFPNGGMAGVMQYLSRNIKYPAIAQENGTQGRVIVQFVVNKDGSITDVKVVRGADPYLDKEAIRVVTNMPKWTPGKTGGKAIRVKYTLPITFKLT